MWRSLFLAVGISCAILGFECMVVEKATILNTTKPALATEALAGMGAQASMPATREFTPPDWAPWSLLSAGAIVVLYSFTIPRRMHG